MKRTLFWCLLILLVLVSIELPFRFFDHLQDRKFKKAQEELTVIPDGELGPLNDQGWRVIEDFEDIDFLKKSISDALRLNREGNIILYPDYRLLKKAPYFTFKVNKMEFRGPDWKKEKGQNEIRIFIIGGSTAFSFLSDEEHSIHGRLEYFLNDLKQDKTKEYRVYLAALPSSNSFHELAIIRKLIMQFNPDIVVAINGFNDAGGNHLITNIHTEREDIVTRLYRMLASSPNSIWIKRSSALHYLADRLYVWSYPKFQARKQTPITGPLKSAAEAYIENMIKIQEILDTNGAKFLVYLQPTLFVPGGKPLTKAEQRVRELSFQVESYSRFLESYPLMLQFLQEKGLHYIDGQKLGTHGLYVGTIDPSASTLLKSEDAYAVPVQQINVISDKIEQKSIGRIIIEHKNGKQKIILYPTMFCGSSLPQVAYEPRLTHKGASGSILQLMYDGTSTSTCVIKGGEEFLKRGVDQAMWHIGYQGVAYATPDDYMIFRFDSPAPIQSGQLALFVSNHKDRDDTVARALISFDGINYAPLPEKSVPFEYRKEVTWDWDASLGTGRTVFFKTSLSRTNNYLGFDGLRVTLRGKQEEYFWDPDDDSLRVVNSSDDSVYLESLQKIGGEGMFVDAAHLNFKANAMLAQEIANYILKYNW